MLFIAQNKMRFVCSLCVVMLSFATYVHAQTVNPHQYETMTPLPDRIVYHSINARNPFDFLNKAMDFAQDNCGMLPHCMVHQMETSPQAGVIVDDFEENGTRTRYIFQASW